MAAPGQQKLALDYCDMGLAIVDGRLVYQGDPEICLELIKEEKQRTKDELRDEYNARLARLKDNDEGAEEYDD
jgi:ABC-type multidrug transport system ATPase subunit